MNTTLLGLLAETSIHPGSGRTMGVVDLPVAREAATDYPVIVGSSLKGALRDKSTGLDEKRANRLFGEPSNAGRLLVSDGRLLLLPVRSLTGSYRWATCPHLIERLRRDILRATGSTPAFKVPQVEPQQVLCAGEGELFLEERHFKIAGSVEAGLIQVIGSLIHHDETRKRVAGQLTILSDDDFAWFARYGLPIQARNVLEEGTKRSKNLWYEESLPPDSLLYALIGGRSQEDLQVLREHFGEEDPYLQVGGNETVGQGWCVVRELGKGQSS